MPQHMLLTTISPRNRPLQFGRSPEELGAEEVRQYLLHLLHVRNLSTSVAWAYWSLYSEYRRVEAARQRRDSALATWQRLSALRTGQSGFRGGEDQAREQYNTFVVALKDSYRNLLIAKTQLRLFMGIEKYDGRFRPSDSPSGT